MKTEPSQNLLKLFSLKEAQKLIPIVKKSLDKQQKWLKELRGVSDQMDAAPKKDKSQAVLEKKMQNLVDHINTEMDFLENLGCVCKDIEKGLVDFPALVNGEIVYFCWKQGEDKIGFWHRIADGYAGRIELSPKVHMSPYWKN